MSAPDLSPAFVAEFLVRLRIELYTAAQRFTGEALDDFKTLIDEIADVLREASPEPPAVRAAIPGVDNKAVELLEVLGNLEFYLRRSRIGELCAPAVIEMLTPYRVLDDNASITIHGRAKEPT